MSDGLDTLSTWPSAGTVLMRRFLDRFGGDQFGEQDCNEFKSPLQ